MTRKKLTIGGAPAGWRSGWEYPGEAFPPGWPIKVIDGCSIDGYAVDGEITVWCLDKYAENTDDLEGQVMQIEAVSGNRAIRMRDDNKSKHWGEALLIKIERLPSGIFGVCQKVEIDWDSVTSPLTIKASIFGMVDSPEWAVGYEG